MENWRKLGKNDTFLCFLTKRLINKENVVPSKIHYNPQLFITDITQQDVLKRRETFTHMRTRSST